MHSSRSSRSTLLAAVAAAALVVAGCASPPRPPDAAAGQPVTIDVPAPLLHDHLVTSAGRAVDLASFAGKVVVISDMMTLCQESCPLDTANVVAAARAVDKDGLADKVEFLSITIDPARDVPAQLAAYRALYAPAPSNWLTLTGSAATLSALWDDLGVFIQKVPESGAAPRNWRTGVPLTYDLTHSDDVFFLGPSQKMRFALTGVPHVAAGAPIPAAIRSFMDARGRANLADPGGGAWTLPQALQAIAWLTRTPIRQAAGGAGPDAS